MIKLVGSEFFIHATNGQLLLLAAQKGFKLKEEIDIFTDQGKTNCIMHIRARQIMDIQAAYDVTDAKTGQRIAVFKRKGWKSILRDEWEVCGPNEEPYGIMLEDSMLLAMVRRFVAAIVPQNYDLNVGGTRVVDFRQNFNPFSYHLNIIIEGQIDPRIAVSGAVLLAAIEGRQSG
ncbi:MAG TPA: hypothetical protein VK171_06415 [Fimbriimonas sp.]|nr:hypothetical protein [Fimbriimonas sp.]